jgi:hypothetical protein
MTEQWNPWGDEPITEDELPLYERWQQSLHEYERDPNDKFGRCKATVTRRGVESSCKATSHSTMHLPMDCCHCRHGVYLHTSYDIPCGRCEMEASQEF